MKLTNKEVTIQREWIEVLIKYAEKSEKLLRGEEKIKAKYYLSSLFGYISSAKILLKHPKSEYKHYPIKDKDFFGLTDEEKQDIVNEVTDEAIKEQLKGVVNFKNNKK